MITDETAREDILKDVSSKNVRHFWTEIFAKQYSKDAGSSAYNKIDKILSTPTVAAMFDAQKSSIDMRDVIEERMMLVVDLSTGASDDIAQFLGSIFLNALYVEAKRRIDVHAEDMEKARQNPFFVYADESHMFSNTTMSESLRALRKFGVKVTLATQTANAYEKDFANEITGLCKTIVTGRCDFATAQMLRAVMSVNVEEMQRLPNHTFAVMSDEHGVSASGVMRARPVPLGGKKQGEWMDAARASVEKWGRKLSVEKYMGGGRDDRLPFTPIECMILHLLHFDRRDWYREELLHRAKSVFPGIMENVVSGAIQRLTRERFARTVKPVPDDGDEREGQMRYVLGDKAHNGYFSEAFGGRRAGGDVHMGVIFAAARMFRRHHCYAMPDLGGTARKAAEGGEPDLYVVEPDALTDRHGTKTYDPLNWSRRSRLAVEVETDARKHMEHTVVNYEKTAGGGGGGGGGGGDGGKNVAAGGVDDDDDDDGDDGKDTGDGNGGGGVDGEREGGNGGGGNGGGGKGEGRSTEGMVATYESEGKEEGHKVWFLCFDQDSHDKLLSAIQERTGQENPPRLEMDVIDGPKVADGRHRLPREPPELLLSGVRIRTIDELIARDAAESEQSEQASEHYNRGDRVAAMNAARKAGGKSKGGGNGSGRRAPSGGRPPAPPPADAAHAPPGPAGAGGAGGASAVRIDKFGEDDYYDDDDEEGGSKVAGGAAGAGAAGAGKALPTGADGQRPFNAATTYPRKGGAGKHPEAQDRRAGDIEPDRHRVRRVRRDNQELWHPGQRHIVRPQGHGGGGRRRDRQGDTRGASPAAHQEGDRNSAPYRHVKGWIDRRIGGAQGEQEDEGVRADRVHGRAERRRRRRRHGRFGRGGGRGGGGAGRSGFRWRYGRRDGERPSGQDGWDDGSGHCHRRQGWLTIGPRDRG